MSDKDGLPNLELKIENMLEELIKTDEDIENNGMRNSLKFSEDISPSEEEKEIDDLIDKDFFSNANFQIEEQNQIKNGNNFMNSINESKNNITLDIMNKSVNNQLNNNFFYNNYSPFIFNHSFSQSLNNNQIISNNLPLFGLSNNNMNNNYNYNLNKNLYSNNNNLSNNVIQKNYELLNSSNSFSTSYEMNRKLSDNNLQDINFNTNYIFNDNNIKRNNNQKHNSLMNNGYQLKNNSFYKESKNYIFNRSRKYHNSYYAGDKISFNRNSNNSNNNYKNNTLYNSNVEFEILLIEVNKIMSKIEKIDQICYNKLKGKFELIICTHKGSRIFQNYLKNTHTDILHQIFLELKNNLPQLLKDNYANYFCKKFFESLSQKDRIEYLTIIQNYLNTLSIDITATYPIQGIIEKLGSKTEKRIIYLGIKDSITIFSYNIYGTHILEKILSYFEDEFTKEIIDFVYNNFIDLSYHINGICIVKKLLLMTHKKDLHQKLKNKIIENALNLIVHQYGNYVIQVIVENWDDNELEDIINLYKNKYICLSKQKYSSNVVERIIEKNKKNLEFYINEICINNNLSEVMRNNYGNYVVQKAVKLSSGKIQEKLIKEIMKIIHKIEDKKVISKWKMIIFSSKQ